jgi:hypothetical protein
LLVPLYAFVKGDTLGIVVLVQDDDTIARVAAVIADSAAMRVAPGGSEMSVRANGKTLDPLATVSASGLGALDRVDLVMTADPHAPLGPRR